jgi:hypothetical protein
MLNFLMYVAGGGLTGAVTTIAIFSTSYLTTDKLIGLFGTVAAAAGAFAAIVLLLQTLQLRRRSALLEIRRLLSRVYATADQILEPLPRPNRDAQGKLHGRNFSFDDTRMGQLAEQWESMLFCLRADFGDLDHYVREFIPKALEDTKTFEQDILDVRMRIGLARESIRSGHPVPDHVHRQLFKWEESYCAAIRSINRRPDYLSQAYRSLPNKKLLRPSNKSSRDRLRVNVNLES